MSEKKIDILITADSVCDLPHEMMEAVRQALLGAGPVSQLRDVGRPGSFSDIAQQGNAGMPQQPDDGMERQGSAGMMPQLERGSSEPVPGAGRQERGVRSASEEPGGTLPLALMYYYVVTEEGRFVDGEEIGTEGLIAYMDTGGGKSARSECPTAEDYRRFFVEKLAGANQILHISMGKGASKGYESALEASRRISRVTVYDSGQVSSGYGLIALKAAQMSAEGRSMEQILSELRVLSREVVSSFVVRDIGYLSRGGRISTRLQSVCERMKLRPLMGMREGRIRAGWLFVGRWRSVIRKFVRRMFSAPWRLDTDVLIITHVCETDEQLQWLRDEVEKYVHFEHIYFQRASAAITSNAGPGAVGFLFRRKHRERSRLSRLRADGLKGVGGFVHDNLKETVLRDDFDIRHRMMNLILLAVFVGGIVSMLVSVFLGAWLGAVIIFFLLLLVVGSLYISLHQRPKAAGLLICLAANTALFPLLFFFSGGTHSGMPLWFALGLIFDCLILSGWQGAVVYLVNLVAMLGVIRIGEFYPETLREMPDGYMDKDIVQTLIIVPLVIGVIFKYQTYLYEKQKKELEQREKDILAASSAKDIFLANMSHEIRTPINGIIGMDTMLLRECGDNENLRMYGKNIQSASQTLLSLVNDILDISKIESGKLELLPIEYELFSVINDCYVMTRARIGDKGLAFHVRLNPAVPEGLYGDEVRLRQIINNILSNAVKYTQEGSVMLEVDMEQFSDATVILVVSVSDTGMGIRQEDIGRLFDSFTRVDELRNRNIEGTGLGLNLTKNLVELMGGEIYVDSVYGQGSTFTVRIPQGIRNRSPIGDFASRLRESVRATEESIDRFIAPDARVLVVDDVPMNLLVAKGLLEYTKISVDTAGSGEEALGMVKKRMYDIIFLDHLMPAMDGVECFREMKRMEDNPNIDTPIIVLTANAILGARQEYMEIGFTDYLSKPIEEEELYQLLRKYLPKEKVLPDTAEQAGRAEEASEATGAREPQASGPVGSAASQSHVEEVPTSARTTEMRTTGQTGNAPSADGGAKTEAALPPAKSLKECLAAVDGLDPALGLKYCMQSEEIYIEALKLYLEGDKAAALEGFLGQEDFDNYRITVHALKSTSLNIGSKPLSERAKESELACKGGDYARVRELHPALMEHCRSFMESLGRAVEHYTGSRGTQ